MPSEWYYQSMGEVIGPLSPAELRKAVESGKIQPDTLVRKGADGPWVFAAQVNGLLTKPK
jgi:hypothetical protein